MALKMLKKSFNFLLFNFKKYYLQPFIRLIKDRETYHRQYDAPSFFDQFHKLSNTGEDRGTISPDFPAADARFHYNSVENVIIPYIKKHEMDLKTVLDIGSGSGHWIDFYLTVFNPSVIYGIDTSEVAIRRLEEKFKNNVSVKIFETDILESKLWEKNTFSLINAIGVIFHIISDKKFEETVQWCYDRLLPGGVLIASDLFGMITANVQFEPAQFRTISEYKEGSNLVCNKRVRSLYYWKRVLKRSGFRKISFKKTRKPVYIHTPENNLVFAVK
jgi:SAM-dependent methyltransferase